MRENDGTKPQDAPRKPPSNIPLMSMAPISSTSNSSSFYQDLTSSLFQSHPASPSSACLLHRLCHHSSDQRLLVQQETLRMR